MKYTKSYIDTIGYELAPVVVSSDEIEESLAPLYEKLHTFLSGSWSRLPASTSGAGGLWAMP